MERDGDARMDEVLDDADSELPWDRLEAAGEPANPIPFPDIQLKRGRRDSVLVFCPERDDFVEAKNVLFQDFSREYGESTEKALSRVREAYWPIPYKKSIRTIMGHVEICHVVTRSKSERGDDDDDSVSDSSCDDSSKSYDDDDEDVVFQLTPKLVAVKVNYMRRVERYRDRHAENPVQEICAMQLIGNGNAHVIGILETLFEGSSITVVMPYAASGDLFDWLQRAQEQGQGMPEAEARYLFRQVMDGLQYLHQKGICHRDLSPENIMLDNNNSIIIDMGMSIRVPYTDRNDPSAVTDIVNGTEKRLIKPQGACGKLSYMSPEIYRNRNPFDGGAVDIWTAGTILFCMVTGNRSYERPCSNDAQFYWMSRNLGMLLENWNINLTVECVDLLKGMLTIDPRHRFTMEQVLNHPWFQGEDIAPNISFGHR